MKFTLAVTALVAVASAAEYPSKPKHEHCKNKDIIQCTLQCLKKAAKDTKCSGDVLQSVCHRLEDHKSLHLKGCLTKCGIPNALTEIALVAVKKGLCDGSKPEPKPKPIGKPHRHEPHRPEPNKPEPEPEPHKHKHKPEPKPEPKPHRHRPEPYKPEPKPEPKPKPHKPKPEPKPESYRS
ncbi:hypothetical protein HRG_009932 [Hirsutella rhossiliensis]|uniref:Uncharacterized protein n=1 Tax=Hirsutella rhossiliensis TaxID=111463 RepID=A0A9P8MTF7_9HYPO|nr:uncharacterized protein HRG_09932 [Hirsutella rhossiliensis]KAH0958887.1 hypothetical protein HRG_09932 [Hirsutella rhossiliensis]